MASTATKTDPRAAIVDELGAISKELAPWRLKIAREDSLRRKLRESAESWPAADGQTNEGLKFAVELGPRAIQRTVNVAKLVKMVSTRCFLGLVGVTLKALADSKIAPDIAGKVIEETQTGSRSIAITEKAGA